MSKGCMLECFTVLSPLLMQDSKSHHERELKAAEEELNRAQKEVEDIAAETSTQQQGMDTLQLEVEELKKTIGVQQGQVGEMGIMLVLSFILVAVTNSRTFIIQGKYTCI